MIDRNFIARAPEDVGVDAQRMEALFARARQDVERGRLPSAQIALARHGKIAGLRSFGTLEGNGGPIPAGDDTALSSLAADCARD